MDYSVHGPGGHGHHAFRGAFVSAVARDIGVDPVNVEVKHVTEGSVVVSFTVRVPPGGSVNDIDRKLRAARENPASPTPATHAVLTVLKAGECI